MMRGMAVVIRLSELIGSNVDHSLTDANRQSVRLRGDRCRSFVPEQQCFAAISSNRSRLRRRNDDTPLGLAEEHGAKRERIPRRQIDFCPGHSGRIRHQTFRKGDGEAAVAAVVRRCEQRPTDRLEQRVDHAALRVEVAARRSAGRNSVDARRDTRWRRARSCSRRGARWRRHRCETWTRVMCASESITPTIPITGVGYTAPRGTLVVERDVAAGDRRAERSARLADAGDGLA